jgi:hypothetical protein
MMREVPEEDLLDVEFTVMDTLLSEVLVTHGDIKLDVAAGTKSVINRSFATKWVDGVKVYIYSVMYSVLGTTPSGYLLTSICNTCANRMILHMASIQSHYDSFDIVNDQILEVRSLLRDMYIIAFGDDHVATYGPKLIRTVGFSGIKKWVTHMGMGYTDEDKTGCEYHLKTLYDVGFLKRKFVFEKILNRHIGQMPLKDILNILCWQKEKEETHIMRDRADCVVKELSYRVDDFERETSKMKKILDPEDFPSTWDRKVALLMAVSQETEYF